METFKYISLKFLFYLRAFKCQMGILVNFNIVPNKMATIVEFNTTHQYPSLVKNAKPCTFCTFF